MKKIELLAPAGSKEALISAISNGADAVYLGGKSFSARAFASNFDDEEIKECVEYAHLRDVKIYVAINTLMNEYELDNAIKQVKYYHQINVDALIIQDLGLYYRILKEVPDMEIHASTQMHVHNIEGVRAVKKLGFKRTVIARESSKEFIREACKEGIEIEIFTHGAICASYSGQCLISAYSKERSANKGMCAQCCRLKYSLFDKDMNRIDTETDYLLSAKDMCLIYDMPEIIDAGVSSIKIEGRMKSSAYVGYVTSLYRKAIDAYYSGNEFILSNNDINKMSVLFNRNFTNKYFHGFGEDIYNNKRPNHLGIKIGEVVGFKNKRVVIKLSDDLKQFDGVRIANYELKDANEFGLIVNFMYQNGKLVNEAKKGTVVELDCKGFISKGSSLYKTLDKKFEEDICSIKEKQVPLKMLITLFKDCPVTIQCEGNGFSYSFTSKSIPSAALKAPLSEQNIIDKITKLNDTPYYCQNIDVITDGISFLRVSELNDIRREMIKELNEYRLKSFSREAIVCDYEEEKPEEDLKLKKIISSDYDVLPVINRQSNYVYGNKAIVSEIGGLFIGGYKIANFSMNVMNSYAYELLLKLGFKNIVVSSELNEQMFNIMCDEYYSRNNEVILPFVLRNRDRTLMYLKENPFEKYMDKKPYFLSDSSNTYRIAFEEESTEIIEDSSVKEKCCFGRDYIYKR